MTLSATYFGANGWLVEFGTFKVLIDPWIKGKLLFGSNKWLFSGEHLGQLNLPENIDLLLLSQGLADHSHRETLNLISREVKVIASESASRVVKELGYRNVDILRPDEVSTIQGLKILATKGARVPNQENGYLLKHSEGIIYLEPHGYIDKSLKDIRVDIAITPIVDLKIPLLGPFIKGRQVLQELIKELNPKYIFASTIGGKIRYSGIASKIIRQEGSYDEAITIINDTAELIEPIPGKRYIIHT